MYKINSLRLMRKTEEYNRHIGNVDNLYYYKLKQAKNIGTDLEQIAFNYKESENLNQHGWLYGFYHKKEPTKKSEKPFI